MKSCPRRHKRISWNAKGNPGAPGPAGPADWNAIPNKPAGFADGVDHAGVTGIKITRALSPSVQIGAGQPAQQFAYCPAGSVAIGGGFESTQFVHPYASLKGADGTGHFWNVKARNTGSGGASLVVIAMCLSVEPTGAFTTAKKAFKPAKKGKKKRR